MTTLRIHSTELIYSPGMFRWLEQLFKDPKQPEELKLEFLAAMGIPEDLHLATMAGEYVSRTEGRTLVITYDVI